MATTAIPPKHVHRIVGRGVSTDTYGLVADRKVVMQPTASFLKQLGMSKCV